ncbi:MAG: serine/threonine-protein kinase [Myxococcaceae bacterium]
MWEPGAVVLDGRFRVDSVLGLSSATEAYIAEQVSLSRKVTLKVIRTDLGLRDQAGERFDREVRRMAAVEHAGVVRVIDSGQAEKVLYLVTELVDGQPLSKALGSEPMLPERAAELISQLAESLAAVHEKGLIHGELRPESITLVKTARGEQAKLSDFGIARLVDAESPDERMTVVARALGPVEYLAPEQLRGANAEAASDVYALGVIAYRMLSGALPFSSPTDKKPRPLLDAAPHLSDAVKLCEVVMQCLADDPKARPAAGTLKALVAAAPKPAEPTLFMESMQRPPELPKTVPVPPPLPPAPPPAAPAPAKPQELMPSIAMPAVTPTASNIDPVLQQLGKPPVAPAPVPVKKGNRTPLMVVGAVLVALIAVVAWTQRSTPARDGRKLVEMRQPVQALEVLNRAIKKESTSELVMLKAAALHLSQSHKDEEAAFKSLPPKAPEALDPLVLAGLAEDFGRDESTSLQTALKGLPSKELNEVFAAFAKEPISSKQWGALRYLDLAGAAQGLKLVDLYSVSLESNTCAVRKSAARRLAQLDDDSAEAALLRLRELPREGPDKNCGQDEAGAALQSLKRAH